MYDRTEYIRPFRKGNTVLNETALVVEYPGITDSDGNITITLLYDIEKVISVTDFGGKKIYEEGTDWFVLDGKLIIPKNSSMPRVPWSVYNPQEAPNDGLNAHFSEGGYILYTEGTLLVDRQIAVTYEHAVNENVYKPVILPHKLPRLAQNLKEQKPLTVAFWGDSITVGCNCSKMLGVEPFMPSWAEMVCDTLREDYGCDVTSVNKAVGGTRVEWGLSEFDNAWKDVANVDLFVIAFGGNNGPETTPEEFENIVEEISKKVWAKYPECEIVTVSVCQGNHYAQDVKCHHKRLKKLYELADRYGSKLTVVPMTALHAETLERKKYWDMTANNINHPNDMLIRMYAQTFSEVFASAE